MKIGDRIRRKEDGATGVLVDVMENRRAFHSADPRYWAIIILDHEGHRRSVTGDAIEPETDGPEQVRRSATGVEQDG